MTTIESERIRFSDLCALYARRKKRKRTWGDDYQRLQFWLEHFGLLAPHRITTTMIEDVLEETARERHWSPATINRYRSAIKGVFSVAVFEGVIRSQPGIKFTRERAKLTRHLKKSDARKLLEAVATVDPMLQCMVQVSLALGIRQGNVVNMKWGWLDLQGKMLTIPADQAKMGVQLDLPLNELAISAFIKVMSMGHGLGGDNDLVFCTKDGKPIKDPAGTTWEKCLKDVGISRFRWHDLRHTWATWHAQGGTPLAIIMKLGGWTSYSSVLRYAKYLPETTKQYSHNTEL